MKRFYTPRELVAPLLVLVLGLLSALYIPSFARLGNFMNILKQSSFAGIVVVGMLFVLITREVDLSVGAQFAFYGMLCAYLMKRGWPGWLAILFTLVVSALIGGLIGHAVGRFSGQSLLLTIAVAVAMQGFTSMLGGGTPIYGISDSFLAFMSRQFFSVSMQVWMLILCAVSGALFLHQTYGGKYLYAVGASHYAAEQSGISVHKTKIMAFSLCSLYTSIGAIAYLGWIGLASFSAGNGLAMDVLTSAALAGVGFGGGKGRVFPVVAAALFLGLLSACFIALNVAPYYQKVLKGAILFVSILTNRSKA